MTAEAILAELKPLGKEGYKQILLNHGVREPVYGVSIENLKKIQKRIRKNHELALALYDTGVYDAMYLAGLIADDARMTKKDLQRWVDRANGDQLCAFTVPWVAAGSPHGWDLALKWIDSRKEHEAVAGWATLGSIVGVFDDEDLGIAALKRLLKRVGESIHQQPDAVRYQMNAFVIAVGSYVGSLSDVALQTGERIGRVTVDMGDTACKVPFAPDYIRKVQQRGTVGKKRKTAGC